MKNEVFQQKQEWLERVMASRLTPATKVFAFGIFKRMYGDKVTSYPDTNLLMEDTGLSRSKFTDHRNALVQAGAMNASKSRNGKGHLENYTYTLNLEWDGSVPSKKNLAPSGNSLAPSGDNTLHPLGTDLAPSGCSNTSSNTTREDSKKDNTVSAGASTVPLLPNKDEDEDFLEGITPSSLPQVDPPALDQTAKGALAPSGCKEEKQTLAQKYRVYTEGMNRDEVSAFWDGINKKRMRPAEAREYALTTAKGIDEW